jgi:hypothetical protein
VREQLALLHVQLEEKRVAYKRIIDDENTTLLSKALEEYDSKSQEETFGLIESLKVLLAFLFFNVTMFCYYFMFCICCDLNARACRTSRRGTRSGLCNWSAWSR